jgi:hypothetical protein
VRLPTGDTTTAVPVVKSSSAFGCCFGFVFGIVGDVVVLRGF